MICCIVYFPRQCKMPICISGNHIYSQRAQKSSETTWRQVHLHHKSWVKPPCKQASLKSFFYFIIIKKMVICFSPSAFQMCWFMPNLSVPIPVINTIIEPSGNLEPAKTSTPISPSSASVRPSRAPSRDWRSLGSQRGEGGVSSSSSRSSESVRRSAMASEAESYVVWVLERSASSSQLRHNPRCWESGFERGKWALLERTVAPLHEDTTALCVHY